MKASLVSEVRKLGSSEPMTFATFQALEVEKANNLQSQEDEGDEDADGSTHEMDTQDEVWAKSPAEESSAEVTFEGRDYTQNY